MKTVKLTNLDGTLSILDELKKNNIYINADCNGHGTCGKCRVIIDGQQVLACQTHRTGDVQVGIPLSEESMLIEGIDKSKASGQCNGPSAICIDIGTTTLAAVRIEKATGNILESSSSINHQRAYGADVISRIQASVNGQGNELQQSIKSDIGSLLKELQYTGEDIIISGNTTMGHLLLGYPCDTLGKAPYTPINIGLQSFDNITILPGISTYVGADIVSGIYALDMDKNDKITAMIDLGTNGEMAIGNKDKLLVTSTAAGPAFEGGNISCGCASIPGAISKVTIKDGDASVETIGNKPAVGICGTGVIDSVSQLLGTGLVDETGLLDDIYFDSGYPLADGITFTQKDIREVQMAKSAVRAGLETLIKEYGVTYEDIDTLYLSGGFGKKIDIGSACAIGLISPELADKTVAAGNTSLAGAIKFACEYGAARMTAIAENSKEISLAESKTFNELYMEYMYFE